MASIPHARVTASSPRRRTSRPVSSTPAELAATVRIRPAAMPCAVPATWASSAAGDMSRVMPGGCTMMKSRYGRAPRTSRSALPKYGPVVVLGHAEQVSRPAEQVQADAQAEQGEPGNGQRDRPGPPPAVRPARRPGVILRRRASRRGELGSAHHCPFRVPGGTGHAGFSEAARGLPPAARPAGRVPQPAGPGGVVAAG